MRAEKAFDCVQMKNTIQARRRKECEGLTDEQIRHRIERRLATSDDIAARKWRKIAEYERTEAKPA